MAYTIQRYPADLIDVVHLPGERRLTIRPVLPQDADILQTFVRDLSAGSRRNRFFRTFHELPQSLLDEFTSIDYRTHLALIAEVFDGDEEVVVGEARYAVGPDGRSAELALAVGDPWQGRGIGLLLVRRLVARAFAQGITLLHGQVLPSNRAMQNLARKAGFSLRLDPQEPGMLRMEQKLNAQPPHHLPSRAA